MTKKATPLDPITEVAEHLTLNKVFKQAPDTVTDAEIDGVINRLRQERALFIKNDKPAEPPPTEEKDDGVLAQ